ncbi:hypothetical protein [Shinella sp. WSD5-1]|nr:protein of unknown function [Shinella sp. WSC3-e]
MRVVIVHPEMGIYLGSCFGLGFFSLLDCAGQTAACTFEDECDARACVSSRSENGDPDAYGYVPVAAKAWAEIMDLEAAGLGEFTGPMKDEALRAMQPAGHS